MNNTTQNPLVVGVFQNEEAARQAITQLHDAGFSREQLGFANTTGQTTETNLHEELVKLGVAQEHAGYYQNAYQAGQHIVSVRADGRDQEAASILSANGATGINADPNVSTTADATPQTAGYNNNNDPMQNPANQPANYQNSTYNNANQQGYANTNNYNADQQQQYGNANQQQYNDPNYSNANQQQQYGNANQQQYNDPNYSNANQQGYNGGQNSGADATAYNGQETNMDRLHRVTEEERQNRERMQRNDNENFGR
ncbi:hypothetical protein KDW_21010 [Dictyobacter vulcani]|uniref:General stress protein 17M-like domain-containing protein n=1 Tax=Dictyobacter vulcani TaxID=2607529 RepID=A0A5J4KPA8_9CHLR|nr:hypothetical protein [Dictyobacter vulcani]GER87939.1 hypothetical protein KDW_21010 [Dictyobacter vulcani]